MRSNQLSYTPVAEHAVEAAVAGGADRDRTDDLLNANQALSQLSYSPELFSGRPHARKAAVRPASKEAGWTRPPRLRLSGKKKRNLAPSQS